MSHALKRPMTVDEFLEWERGQELRYEFDGMNVFAMTGGTFAHAAIATNLLIALGPRLAGSRCQAVIGTVKVRTRAGQAIRYPDVIATCMPVDRASDIVPEPVIVFEVLSSSSARKDRVTKNVEYEGVTSIRRYVILEQDIQAATVFARSEAGWTGTLLTGADAVLPLPELNVALPFAEIYAGLDVPDRDDTPDEPPTNPAFPDRP